MTELRIDSNVRNSSKKIDEIRSNWFDSFKILKIEKRLIFFLSIHFKRRLIYKENLIKLRRIRIETFENNSNGEEHIKFKEASSKIKLWRQW